MWSGTIKMALRGKYTASSTISIILRFTPAFFLSGTCTYWIPRFERAMKVADLVRALVEARAERDGGERK